MHTPGKTEIQYDTLFLNDSPLDLKTHSPHDVDTTLKTLGRDAIINAIEEIYERIARHNPGCAVERPSLTVMNLGDKQGAILTRLGKRNATHLHRTSVELQPRIRELGDIIHDHGF